MVGIRSLIISIALQERIVEPLILMIDGKPLKADSKVVEALDEARRVVRAHGDVPSYWRYIYVRMVNETSIEYTSVMYRLVAASLSVSEILWVS